MSVDSSTTLVVLFLFQYETVRDMRRYALCSQSKKKQGELGTWIRTIDVAPILRRIFEDPSRVSIAAHFSEITLEPPRDVVVVGHGLGNDDKYLRTLGFLWAWVICSIAMR